MYRYIFPRSFIVRVSVVIKGVYIIHCKRGHDIHYFFFTAQHVVAIIQSLQNVKMALAKAKSG